MAHYQRVPLKKMGLNRQEKIMQPHQQRVVDEKATLDSNIERLGVFLVGDILPTLEADEQADLHLQLEQMTAYSDTLGRRIARF
jgi:hypothetical protein